MKKGLLNSDEQDLDGLDLDEMDLDERYLGQKFPGKPAERIYLLKLLKKMLQKVRPEEIKDCKEFILAEAESIVKKLK